MTAEATRKKGRGGRPKGDPEAVRVHRINARLTADELSALNQKAALLGIPPAQFLRDAALKRRLPPPPVPAINRQQYAELARLSANLNQLAHAANSGQPVTVPFTLLQQMSEEVTRLRLALINAGDDE